MPRKKANYKPKICDVCGSEFVPNGSTHRRCSKECKKAGKAAYGAAHYKANRDKILARSAARYEANRDKRREQMAAHLEANRERYKEYYAEYYKANKVQHRRHRQLRRARLKNVACDPTVCKTELHIRSGGRCNACGVMTDLDGPDSPTKAHLDHIIPLAHTGTHTWDNVQILCRSCNLSKSDKVQWDFEPKNPHEEDTVENPFSH